MRDGVEDGGCEGRGEGYEMEFLRIVVLTLGEPEAWVGFLM